MVVDLSKQCVLVQLERLKAFLSACLHDMCMLCTCIQICCWALSVSDKIYVAHIMGRREMERERIVQNVVQWPFSFCIFSEEDEVVGMDILDEVGVNLQVGGANLVTWPHLHILSICDHLTTLYSHMQFIHVCMWLRPSVGGDSSLPPSLCRWDNSKTLQRWGVSERHTTQAESPADRYIVYDCGVLAKGVWPYRYMHMYM